MIHFSQLVFCLPSLAIPCEITQKNHHIPYELLYKIEEKPNKNTMEYNTLTTEELVREQNIKILEEIHRKELEIHINNHK